MKLSKNIQERIIWVAIWSAVIYTFVMLGKHYDSRITLTFFLAVISLSIFNLIIRNFTWSKPFILSPLNFYTLKHHKNYTVDLPIDIAFGKFKEVLLYSEFKVVKIDSDTKEIYARSEFNFFAGGENLYLKFTPKGNQTKLEFSSVSPRMYDFYKNPKNIRKVLTEFEKGLTI